MPFTSPPGAPPSPPPSPSRADGDEAFSAKADAHAAWMMIITTWFTGFVAWLITFIGELNASFETIQNDVESASNSKLSAAESAASALESKNVSTENRDISVSSAASALESKNFALAAASQVDVAGALAGLPPKAGSALKAVRVNAGATGFEYFDATTIYRLHVLSVAASSKVPLSVGYPIFDKTVNTSLGSVGGVMWTGLQFLAFAGGAATTCSTSPTGEVWTSRTVGASQQYYMKNNGQNVVATYSSNPLETRKSADGGVTWAAGATAIGAGFATPMRMAYTTGGVCLICSGTGTQAVVSTNNAGSWSAVQAMPHTSTNVFSMGNNIVSYNNASNTYYISTTGLAAGWTAKALPDGIAAGTIWEDGSGGLVLIPNDAAKNYWRTIDGDNWVDLGFNKASHTYGGLSGQLTTSPHCPQYVNGNWIAFNQAAAGSGGMGGMVKYAGNTWVPILIDQGTLIYNSSPTAKLTATNNAGITIMLKVDGSGVYYINTNTDKCMAHFV